MTARIHEGVKPDASNYSKILQQQRKIINFKVARSIPSISTGHTQKSSMNWGDLVYRYFSDVDALKLYFIRAVPGIIVNSEKLTPNITADFDSQNKIVAVEILGADFMLPCHFDDVATYVNNRPSFLLACQYVPEQDVFEVFFVNIDVCPIVHTTAIEETKIIQLLGSDDKLVGLRIQDASQIIRKAPIY